MQKVADRLEDVYVKKEGGLYKVLLGNFPTKAAAADYMQLRNVKGLIVPVTHVELNKDIRNSEV